MFDAGLRTAHAVSGVSVTYTEAGTNAQAVTALEVKTRARGDGDLETSFVFRRGTLTIDDEAWRGAVIVGSDSNSYVIEDRADAPGKVTFIAAKPLQRA